MPQRHNYETAFILHPTEFIDQPCKIYFLKLKKKTFYQECIFEITDMLSNGSNSLKKMFWICIDYVANITQYTLYSYTII